MILAQVLGTVVSTRKDHGLMGLKLLLCREVDGRDIWVKYPARAAG